MENLFLQREVIKGILSSPIKGQIKKINIRYLVEKQVYQCSTQEGNQEFHNNYLPEVIYSILKNYLPNFKQLHLYTQDFLYHYLWNGKGKETLIQKKINQPPPLQTHNHSKKYILSDKEKIPFLSELGIQSASGLIKSDKRDKFIQINKFLEILLPYLEGCKTVVDFGCGKAYLTFALAHFFKGSIVGIDLKETLLDNLNQIAKKLNYTHLSFQKGDIKNFDVPAVDAVIALHACNTATDEAIYQGIKRGAKLIVVAPCCQQELYHQIDSSDLQPLLKHGILKERIAALATDAARAELLTIHGYKTDVMEFIDHGHTPKNILIRAVKTGSKGSSEAYHQFCNSLKINPHLGSLLQRLC